MNPTPILTVGIPTYNRADAVVARVRELALVRESLNIEVLVIDNASTDGTGDALRELQVAQGFEIQSNEENLGYAGNLLRLIDVAKTDYLTICSDEDRVELGGLRTLIRVLTERRPAVVSPRAQVGDDDCYRGRRATRTISPSEFEAASFYVSGLTLNVPAARRHATLIESMLPENAAAFYYPQVLLTALAVLEGEGLFLDALVTRQVVQLETRIARSDHGSYWHVPGRWAQFEGFEVFFDAVSASEPATNGISEMRAETRSGIFSLLEAAALAQYPELATVAQSRRKSVLGTVARLLRVR